MNAVARRKKDAAAGVETHVLLVRAGVEKRQGARRCSGGRGGDDSRRIRFRIERCLLDVHRESAVSEGAR